MNRKWWREGLRCPKPRAASSTPTYTYPGTGIILTQLHPVLEPAGAAAPHLCQKHLECLVLPVSRCLQALFRPFPWQKLSALVKCLCFNTEQWQSWEHTHDFHWSLQESQNYFMALGVARKLKGNGQSFVSQMSTEDCYEPQCRQYFSLISSTYCLFSQP